MADDFNLRTAQTTTTTQTETSQHSSSDDTTEAGVAQVHIGSRHIQEDEVSVGVQDKATGMSDAANQSLSRASDRPLLGAPDEHMLNSYAASGSEVYYQHLAKFITGTTSSPLQGLPDDDTLAGIARRRQMEMVQPSAEPITAHQQGMAGDSQSDSSGSENSNNLYSGSTGAGGASLGDSAATGGSSSSQTSGDDTGIMVEVPAEAEADTVLNAMESGLATGTLSVSGLIGAPSPPDESASVDLKGVLGMNSPTPTAYSNITNSAQGTSQVLDSLIGTNIGGIPPLSTDGTYNFFSSAYVGSGNLDPTVMQNLQATIAQIQGKTSFTATEAKGFQSFLNLVTSALIAAQQMTQTMSATETKISEEENALGADLAKQILQCMRDTIQKVEEAAAAAKSQKMWGLVAAIGGMVLGAVITAITLGAAAPVGAIVAAVVITSAMAAITIADACTGVITQGLQSFCAILTNGFNNLLTELNNGKPVDPEIGKILTGILIIAVVIAMVLLAKSPAASEGMMEQVFGEAGAKMVTSEVVIATIQASVMLLTAANSFGELVQGLSMINTAEGNKPWNKDAVNMAAMIVQIVFTVLACFMAAKASKSAIEAGAEAAGLGVTKDVRVLQERLSLFAAFCQAGLGVTTGVVQYNLNELQAKITQEQGAIDAMCSFLQSLQVNNTQAKKDASEAMKIIMDAIQQYVQTITGVRNDETTMAGAALV